MELMKTSEENKVFVHYIFSLSSEDGKQRRMVACS